MQTLLNLISNIGTVFIDLVSIIWNVTKWLFGKCWKFILLIGAIFVAIFGIKKAAKEDS